MKDLILVEQEQPSDCDILIGKTKNTLDSLENCFDTIVDDKKSKLNVVSSMFKFGTSLTKLTLSAAGCAVKNTPKAVVAYSSKKKQIVNAAETLIDDINKEFKKNLIMLKVVFIDN